MPFWNLATGAVGMNVKGVGDPVTNGNASAKNGGKKIIGMMEGEGLKSNIWKWIEF